MSKEWYGKKEGGGGDNHNCRERDRIHGRTDADVVGDPADEAVGDAGRLEDGVHLGVAQLLVVEEGGVRVDVRVEALVHDGGVRRNLEGAGGISFSFLAFSMAKVPQVSFFHLPLPI